MPYLVLFTVLIAISVSSAYALTITLGGDLIEILGTLNMNNNKITSLAEPTVSDDAATKAYVDSAPGTDTLALLGCSSGEVAQFIGSVWTCANLTYTDEDAITAVEPLISDTLTHGTSSLNGGETDFTCDTGIFGTSSALNGCGITIPTPGQLQDLTVVSATSGSLTAPGIGESWTITVFVNGFSTSLSCTILHPATSCIDTTNVVLVSPRDMIDVQVVASAGAVSSLISPSTMFRS